MKPEIQRELGRFDLLPDPGVKVIDVVPPGDLTAEQVLADNAEYFQALAEEIDPEAAEQEKAEYVRDVMASREEAIRAKRGVPIYEMTLLE